MVLIKKIINKIFYLLGFELKKRKSFHDSIELIKRIEKVNPIIFDVGANEGQSIKEYLNIFNNPEIHSFEPLYEESKVLKIKYGNWKNIHINCFALGSRTTEKKLNVSGHSRTSSFLNFTPDSEFLKVRSEQLGIDAHKYVVSTQKVMVNTIDRYCKSNKINHIDLLKIDTQGYELEVLKGAREFLENQKINIIKVEIMFDNVYEKFFTFSDYENLINPEKYRFVKIDIRDGNIFNKSYAGDLYFFNKKYFKLK